MVRQSEAASGRDGIRQSTTLRLSLPGHLRIYWGQNEIELTGVKRRSLLFLALKLGRPVNPERIVEALWPGRPTGREEAIAPGPRLAPA
jgi:DNA-binding response OmpR family regulator